ncbi:Na+/H+ antiporter NhaC family protein [Peptoanaerobacter stomatis]|uniref:Na+/H+ antiporter NhaC family protein n=1 Tax=Peptoanaerobacter stomatis TaxID=796937 RepID=UPI003FA085B7
MEFGVLSIVPPLVAIILALITKEVISSLMLGIFAGGLIFTGGDILNTFQTIFELMGSKLGDNGLMILFLSLLGALVTVMNRAGGSFAYGKWAGEKIKSKSMAKVSAGILGILIFIDDYFNCLTVGAVMRPITDKNKVSCAKLAYIIDSTAAPVCIIAPVSSWAASVVSNIGSANVDNPMGVFISTIPFNLYALLTIFSVFFFALVGFDIGPMASLEMDDTSANNVMIDDEELKHSEKGKVIDLILPVAVLIVVTIFFMLRTGGYFDGSNPTLKDAFGNASVNISLVLGSTIALVVAFLMYIPRKLLAFREFMECITEGVKSMVGAMIILTLAWTIGGITKEEYLNTGGFVAHHLASNNIPIWIFPAIIFVVAAFLAFSTGTAWGTFGILIPIIVPIIVNMDAMSHISIILASIFSGSVFGDHCSPISDTTILSSAGANCNHIDHVSSQLPYAFVTAIASFIGFIIGGYFNNVIVSLGTALISLLILIFVAKKLTYDKLKV